MARCHSAVSLDTSRDDVSAPSFVAPRDARSRYPKPNERRTSGTGSGRGGASESRKVKTNGNPSRAACLRAHIFYRRYVYICPRNTCVCAMRAINNNA